MELYGVLCQRPLFFQTEVVTAYVELSIKFYGIKQVSRQMPSGSDFVRKPSASLFL